MKAKMDLGKNADGSQVMPGDLLGDMMGDHGNVDPAFVDPVIYSRLAADHSKEQPGMPFSWMVSYTGKRALNNIRVFENGSRHCKIAFPVRVFFSTWTDAIVSTFVPLEAIREPHVMEWFSTFYEVPVEKAKALLEQYPKWPYDGRNADLLRAEMMVAGGPQFFLKKSEDQLHTMGIDIPSKW